jgi:hypothetical protein
MNEELLKHEIRQIESRHNCPAAARDEVFALIRNVLEQIEGGVDPAFKRALKAELDRAYVRGMGGAEQLAA